MKNIANNEKEIWRAHPEYVGIEVSTFGNVRSLDKVVPCRGNGTRLVKGQILKPWDSGIGYMQVGITIDGKRVNKYVHSLAAQTFIKNTDNLPEVNHKSCDRSDNRVINLEWCSRSYIMMFREKFGISNTESLGRPVFAVNLKTLEVSRYPSQHEASRELGLFQPSVNNVIKGRYKYTNGYWFVNDDENADDAIKRKLQTLQSQALGL